MSSDNLIREIEEDLRAENLARLWRDHSHLIIGAAVAVIVAVGGVSGWKHYRISRAQESGDAFVAAARQMDLKEFGKAEEAYRTLSETGTAGYAVLASFLQAEALLKENKTDEAIAVYERIAKDGRADAVAQDLAALQAVKYRMDMQKMEGVAATLDRLSAEDRPFVWSAKELKALYLLGQGQMEDAALLLSSFVMEEKVPQSIRDRAAQMLSSLHSGDNPVAPEQNMMPEAGNDDAS